MTGGTDFATCGADFLNGSSTIYAKYVYNGTVKGILAAAHPVLITVEGCRELCGSGTAYYAWYFLSSQRLFVAEIYAQERCGQHYYYMGLANYRSHGPSPL